MKTEEEHSLIYHALHSRPMPGCLPLFMLMAAIFVGVMLLMVDVKMPERVHPEGHGKITYNNDAITAIRMQLRSPLPLLLPVYADPTRQDVDSGQNLPRRFEPSITKAASQAIFDTVPASMVTDEHLLLALPPETPVTTEKEPTP